MRKQSLSTDELDLFTPEDAKELETSAAVRQLSQQRAARLGHLVAEHLGLAPVAWQRITVAELETGDRINIGRSLPVSVETFAGSYRDDHNEVLRRIVVTGGEILELPASSTIRTQRRKRQR